MRLSLAPVALAAALAAIAVVALAGAAGRAPAPGRETTYWLAVESLAVDGDDRLRDADRERFAARFGAPPAGVQVVPAGDEKRLDAPWLWSRLAAGARAALGRPGPAAVQVALFAWTALLAAATLRSRFGAGGAARLVTVALLASAAFAVPFRMEPRALELAAMATAAAAIWHRRTGPARPADDVYRGDLTAAPSPARWLVAGAGGAIVVAATPSYAPLLAPLLAAAPAGRRGRALALFAAGFAAAAAARLWLGGAPWEAIDLVASPALYGWAAVGLAVGRGVGLAPYFLPLLLLATLGGRTDGRSVVMPALLAAVALQLLLAPFDFVEGALAPGNAWCLPLLALLLVAAEGGESPGATWTVAAVALPLLAAPWLAALGAERLAAAVERRVAAVERLLPAASTLRLQPGAADLERGGLRVRAFAPGLAPAGDGKLRWREASADLLVIADRPLSSLRLELGAAAPARFDLRGGTLGNTTYRPSGEVAVDVALDPRKARRHPVWWSRDGAWSYPLELRLERAPAESIPLDVPFGRLAVPAAEAR